VNTQKQVSYDLFEFMVASRVALARHKEMAHSFNSDSGFFAICCSWTLGGRSAHDQAIEDYIARLERCDRYSTRTHRNIRIGMRDRFHAAIGGLDGVSKVVAGANTTRETLPCGQPFGTIPTAVRGGYARGCRTAGAGRVTTGGDPA